MAFVSQQQAPLELQRSRHAKRIGFSSPAAATTITIESAKKTTTRVVSCRLAASSKSSSFRYSSRLFLADADSSLDANPDSSSEVDLELLKKELAEYLQKRKESGADEKAKENVGKVVGGTRGNALLDWVSLAPNKPTVIDTPPNPFDYDELIQYGYGHLVTPIMKAGGRFQMYALMGLDPPPVTITTRIVSAPELVIDRTGETDPARYKGLKLGQVLDYDLQGQALEEYQKKAKSGESLGRPKLQEEEFVQPFADKRNTSPKLTPDWTAEKLDEWGVQQGRAQAWARRARLGEFIQDPNESLLELPLDLRMYSIVTSLLLSIAFGASTVPFLNLVLAPPEQTEATATTTLAAYTALLQAPALALLVASIGSSVYCAMMAKSSDQNRNSLVWAVKGLLGGPLTVKQLRNLPGLVRQQGYQASGAAAEEETNKQ